MLYEHFLIIFVFNFLHLTCIGGTLTNLEICFEDNFFLINFFNFVTKRCLVNGTILEFSDASHVAILLFIINFVISGLSLSRLSTALVAHVRLLGRELLATIVFVNFLNKLNLICITSFLFTCSYIIFQNKYFFK